MDSRIWPALLLAVVAPWGGDGAPEARAEASAAGPGDPGPALSVRTVAWGRPDHLLSVGARPAVWQTCPADSRRDGSCVPRLELVEGALTEWWVDRNGEVEQGWTVSSPPPGAGPLVFDLALPGDLVASRDGQTLTWTDGERAGWSAGRLSAVDAAGRALPVRFARRDGGARVVVDDAGATWPVVVDPVYSAAGWGVEGDGEYAISVGERVSAAGDVNGDGWPDVLVAVTTETGGGVYVHLGSAEGFAASPAVILAGREGLVPAAAGDVDGDGYDDVVVGDPAEAGRLGAVELYLGSPLGLSDTPDLTLFGLEWDDRLGSSVAGAGDVDGDGYDDVVIGAYAHDVGDGRAYLYLGSPAGLESAPAAVYTGTDGEALGASVAGAGDVNADGYADLLLGAPWNEAHAGRVYLVLGSADGPAATPAVELATGVASAELGTALAGVGDVDGDGFDDVVVGAPYDEPSTVGGRAYVYRGTADGLESTPAVTLEAPREWARFGISVAGPGDVDGDGFPDLLVGAAYGANAYNAVYLYSGGPTGLDPTATAVVAGPETRDAFGASVAGAGDVDGDGFADVLVGAPETATGLGVALLHRGAPEGLAADADTVVAGATPDRLGFALAGVGDVDGDGYGDVVLGAPGFGGGAGRTLLYAGSSAGPSGEDRWGGVGDAYYVHLGECVLRAGDVNGDGYDDVVLVSNTLTVDQYFGGPAGLDPEPSTDGLDAGGGWPCRGTGAVDLDGDGYDDLLLAHDGYGSDGWIAVYRGSPAGLVAPPATVISGASSDEYFGRAAAVVGDVDGDGYDDVVAARTVRSVAQVELYRGGPGGLGADAPTLLSGVETGGTYWVIEGVGDVDGDGYADVGLATTGVGRRAGMVYLYLGAAGGISAGPVAAIADPFEKDQEFPQLARDLDLDGDGYADLVVGYATDSVYAGEYGDTAHRVSVYRGSSGGISATPDLVLTGDAQSVGFGSAVANAGDVDGDGCDDLLVGDPLAGGEAGRAWWYRGCAPDDDADGIGADVDCDDADPGVGAGAVWSPDADGDGYGDSGASVAGCAAPAGHVLDGGDCDDGDPAVSPDAEEVCDGVDDDCDGLVDELRWWWPDGDGDGYGTGRWSDAVPGCTRPGGYAGNHDDCADDDFGRHPDALELCDGVDNDCDYEVDAGAVDATRWYLDRDGDGHGDERPVTASCETLSGATTTGGDCDDGNARVHPGAREVCNDVDDDCDGTVDEGVPVGPPGYPDADGDGFGSGPLVLGECGPRTGYADVPGDCDDADATVHPTATEVPGDGLDQDCDGRERCYLDADADGWRSDHTVPSASFACDVAPRVPASVPAGDCNDLDPGVHPGVIEPAADGIDQNCDGVP